MRFRFFLPLLYLCLIVILFLGHAQGAGHGMTLQLVPYISFPTMTVLEWCVGEAQFLSSLIVYVLATAFQWFLVGYLIDVLRSREKTTG